MVSEEPAVPLCRVVVNLEEGGGKFFRKVDNHFRITQCCNLEYQNSKHFVMVFFLSCRGTVCTEQNVIVFFLKLVPDIFVLHFVRHITK